VGTPPFNGQGKRVGKSATAEIRYHGATRGVVRGGLPIQQQRSTDEGGYHSGRASQQHTRTLEGQSGENIRVAAKKARDHISGSGCDTRKVDKTIGNHRWKHVEERGKLCPSWEDTGKEQVRGGTLTQKKCVGYGDLWHTSATLFADYETEEKPVKQRGRDEKSWTSIREQETYFVTKRLITPKSI